MQKYIFVVHPCWINMNKKTYSTLTFVLISCDFITWYWLLARIEKSPKWHCVLCKFHALSLSSRSLQVKSEVRRMKGIPALVSMLDNPKKEVHYAACGALKNISYGRDPDNKIAIKNCDGIPALVRLLRKTRDQDLTDTITGTQFLC